MISVGVSVGATMEKAALSTDRVLLLGPLEVIKNGRSVRFPPSRKVRALLAYLLMASRPVSRETLCEVFWDVADDPRSELRWCLSKLRSVVDAPRAVRLLADREQVLVETSSLEVDALSLGRRWHTAALTNGSLQDLRSMRGLFRGAFLQGLSLDRAPRFDNWLAGQRHRFDRIRQQVLRRLSEILPQESDDRIDVLRECIESAPLNESPHIELVRLLVHRGLYAAAEQQTAASLKLFRDESLDPAKIEAALREAQRPHFGAVSVSLSESVGREVPSGQAVPSYRPTVLVMPLATGTPESIPDADSITSDVIFGIAKLRSVSIIAQGTAFSLRTRPPAAAAASVGARYVTSGKLVRDGKRYRVWIELSDPGSGHILWADEFCGDAVDTFCVPPLLAGRIVAALDAEIQVIERNRALLAPPSSLDAWQAYHRGLAHMYRFTDHDNHEAQHFFAKAISFDPTFSRSYAGMSFTHFQNAFLLQAREREKEVCLAFETAGQGVEADPTDPAVHWAMGRALWLRHQHDGAVGALDQSLRLGPNFALAHYAVSFVHCQTGNPARALEAADIANRLSPLDPMLFAMHGTRTFALLRLGQIQKAADFASRLGQQPNTHVHGHAIAALTLAAAGRIAEASMERSRIQALRPDYNLRQFKAAFHLLEDLADIYQRAATLVQIPD